VYNLHFLIQLLFQRLDGVIDGPSCNYRPLSNTLPGSVVRLCKCTAPPPSKVAFGRFFVEINARDGINHSPTAFFEFQMGWRGVCTQRSGFLHVLLESNRPHCKVFKAVVNFPARGGRRPNPPTVFTFVQRNASYLYSCVSPVRYKTDLHCKTAELATEHARKINATLYTERVLSLTMAGILNEAGVGWCISQNMLTNHIDFLSVISEATDDVIESINFKLARFSYIALAVDSKEG
jgi:hypothetical protein